jgi:hypothetical protein
MLFLQESESDSSSVHASDDEVVCRSNAKKNGQNYETKRAENIHRNQQLLKNLGLFNSGLNPKKTAKSTEEALAIASGKVVEELTENDPLQAVQSTTLSEPSKTSKESQLKAKPKVLNKEKAVETSIGKQSSAQDKKAALVAKAPMQTERGKRLPPGRKPKKAATQTNIDPSLSATVRSLLSLRILLCFIALYV